MGFITKNIIQENAANKDPTKNDLLKNGFLFFNKNPEDRNMKISKK